MTARIITAQKVVEGTVVYRTPEGLWSTRLEDAVLVPDGEEGAIMEEVRADETPRQIVVGAYAFEAESGGGGPIPTSRREKIRAGGPTVGRAANGA